MRTHWFPIIGLGLLSLTIPAVRGAGPEDDPDVRALAAKIDQLIAAGWDKDVQPAPLADDAEFFRRVHLDLAGRIPSIIEMQDFLDDDRPNKRRIWVEQLLKKESYSDHFTNVWRDWLLAQTNQQQFFFFRGGLEAWLHRRLRDNARYDMIVRELITAQAGGNQVFTQPGVESPAAFYQANENKAENLAGSTARLFLGVKLECAQCHDHPFAQWKRQQFWEYAAFFAGVTPQGVRLAQQGQQQPQTDKREIKIPGTDKVVQARFLDGSEPPWKDGVASRATLADWMTAADNPYFARAAANRMWSYFFGIGLNHQAETTEDSRPPSHAELLDELARQFAAHNFDLKFLIRAITASEAYQRGSALTHPSQKDGRLFARMSLRGLSPEQLFDSLATATEYQGGGGSADMGVFIGRGNGGSPRAQFLAKFAAQEQRTDYQTSILQALYLMNNEFIADRTSLEKNRTLRTLADQKTSTARRLDSLFLAVLSRKARPEELERLGKYLESGGPTGDSKKAITDVFWALLNSSEFLLNH
jgi:hypothetical protein